MKSLVLKIGFFFVGKLLKKPSWLGLHGSETAFNAVPIAESLVPYPNAKRLEVMHA